jgi:hypothetical protein
MPITPITANVVKAMSMSDIFIDLRSINKKSHDYDDFADIVAIFGEVVYLLLFHHEYITDSNGYA